MIKEFKVNNFGPINTVSWNNLSDINVIIGANASGKTLLLKLLYTAVKSLEEFNKGDDKRSYKEVLNEKIKWVFQLDKIGNLVTKGVKSDKFKIEIKIDDITSMFSFTSSAEKGVGEVLESIKHRNANSIFLPAKEVLSLSNVIKSTRGIDKQFGFDDTYYDLIRSLEKNPTKGKISKNFLNVFDDLKSITKGDVDYIDGKWIFKDGKETFNIYVVAEGLKKIAILERLIRNRTLNSSSILFVDEPEVYLHPKAEIIFVEMLYKLSRQGIQIFLATHSYFVIKKLILLAQKNKESIPVLSLNNDKNQYDDLKYGFPDNPIINSAIDLYEEELALE